MLCYDGQISLYNFLGTTFTTAIIFLPTVTVNYLSSIYYGLVFGPLLYFAFTNVLIKAIYKGNAYQIAVRAGFLGFAFACGLVVKSHAPAHISNFGTYVCVLSLFHYSEFLVIAIVNPKLVTTDSYVINHSRQYTVAAVASWVEFFLESYYFPSLKTFCFSYIGLVMCVVGDALRKGAMFTAKSNFTHLIQCEKSAKQYLVTHGVYSLFRHPSYVGWFYWSIGTQIILLNPVCIIVYAYASWCFLKKRIDMEEMMLIKFFGQDYVKYKSEVGTGLPFVYGYKLDT